MTPYARVYTPTSLSGTNLLVLILFCLSCISCSNPATHEVITPPEPFVRDNVTYVATQSDLDAFFRQNLESLAIICYTSKFCKACGPYSETFRKAAGHFSDNALVRFAAIDIYYDDTVLEKVDISIVPSTVISRNNEKLKELTGPGTYEKLIAIIGQFLDKP